MTGHKSTTRMYISNRTAATRVLNLHSHMSVSVDYTINNGLIDVEKLLDQLYKVRLARNTSAALNNIQNS